MTSTVADGRLGGLGGWPEKCLRCGKPLPEKRRRTKRYCGKSCCNMTSAERVARGEASQDETVSPFWPLGLEADFALLSQVRQSVRTVCSEMAQLLRQLDSEERDFRTAVENMRGRYLSTAPTQNVLETVRRRINVERAKYEQRISNLHSEKETALELRRRSDEKVTALERELSQLRMELQKKEEDARRRAEVSSLHDAAWKERQKALATERTAATEKYNVLRTEHEQLKQTHRTLVESIGNEERTKPSHDEVRDVSVQLSRVGTQVSSIHEWMQGQKASGPAPSTAQAQPSAGANELGSQLVKAIENAAPFQQLRQVEKTVVTLASQTDILVKQAEQRSSAEKSLMQAIEKLKASSPVPTTAQTQPSTNTNELGSQLVKAIENAAPFQQLRQVEKTLATLASQTDLLVKQTQQRSSDEKAAVQASRKQLELHGNDTPKAAQAALSSQMMEQVVAGQQGQQKLIAQMVAALQRLDEQLALLRSTHAEASEEQRRASQSAKDQSAREEVTRLTKENRKLRRENDKLTQLERKNAAIPSEELDDVERLMFAIVDLGNECAKYQAELGHPVEEIALTDESPRGILAAARKRLKEERRHLFRASPPMFEAPLRWEVEGERLAPPGEARLEDILEKQAKRLHKLYDELHAEYHGK